MKHILASLCVLLLAACKKESVTEEIAPEQTKWTEFDKFGFEDRIMLNTHVFNDSIIGFRNNGLFSIVNARKLDFPTDGTGSKTGGYIIGNSSRDLFRKPAFSDNLLISIYNDQQLLIEPIRDRASGSGAGLPALQYDADFVRIARPFLFRESTPIVADRYVLVPYHAQKGDGKQYAFLLNVAEESFDMGVRRTRIVNVKKLVFEPPAGRMLQVLHNVEAVGNKFFITYDDDTFRVDTTGNIKSFGAPMYSVNSYFTLNNVLFAINPNGRFYTSTDQGETFNLFTATNESLWGFFNFETIGQEVFGYTNDEIFEMKLNGNTLSWQALENAGLERSRITSIAKCGNRAWVTTLNGVFYKDWDKFKTPKQTPQ
ncbi:MAG: hypothetical protein MUD08_17850 [Cytophagales bacterium]|nr:hypothetical protein [Cytophagales bacterium]